MEKKWDIKKMAKQVTRHIRRHPDRRLMHPTREWLIGLVIFLVLAVSGSIYEVRNFIHYSSLEEQVSYEPLEIEKYQDKAARRVLESYVSREQEFNDILSSYPGGATEILSDTATDEELSAGDQPADVEPTLD